MPAGTRRRPWRVIALCRSPCPDANAVVWVGPGSDTASKAHAFVDGNKRTAFVTALTFLRLNGLGFRPDPVQGVRMMEDLASNDVTEAAFAAWLEVGIEGL